MAWQFFTSSGQEKQATSYLSGELAYAQITSSVNVNVDSTAPRVIVTAPAVSFDGTPVIVQFESPYINPVANEFVWVWLFEDGVAVSEIGLVGGTSSTTTKGVGGLMQFRYAPSAGSHTLSIRASRNNTDCQIRAGAGTSGAEAPAYIRVLRA